MALLALLPYASTTGEDLFVWETPESDYISAASLTSDPATCCGANLIGDPAYAEEPNACNCDLTVGACDVGCCCDPDCASIDVTTTFDCEDNSTDSGRAGVRMCSPDLVTVNLPASTVARGWSTVSDLDGLLCVVTDNSASRGAYYHDPTESTGAFTAEEVANELAKVDEIVPTYAHWLDASGSQAAGQAAYRAGDVVLGDGCLSRADPEAGCASLRPMLLPGTTSVAGACAGSRPITFLDEIAPYSCLDERADLAELCAGQLSPAAYFSALSRFAPSPSLFDLKALAFFLVTGHDANGTATFQPVNSTALPATTLLEAEGDLPARCANAMSVLQYRFEVDGAKDLIQQVNVYIELAEMTSASPQQFGAGFEFVGEAAAKPDAREVSGRPGYLRGHPLLVSNGPLEAIQLRREPLPLLPRSKRGVCAASGEGGAVSTPLLFEDEVATSCSLAFDDASALQAWCETQLTPADIAPLAALNLTLDGDVAGYIGAFGDSHPGNADEWLPLTVVQPSSGLSARWDPLTQSCSGVLGNLQFEVLYAEVGAVLRPHKEVLGARLVLSEQTVQASRCVRDGPCQTHIAVSASSSYVLLPDGGRIYDFVPPLPTVIPPLPSDLFYPFMQVEGEVEEDSDLASRRRRRRLSSPQPGRRSSRSRGVVFWPLRIATGLLGAGGAFVAFSIGRSLVN